MLMFIDINRSHFHSPSRCRVSVGLPPEREKGGWCGSVTQELVRNTRRGDDFRINRHGHIDEHEIRGWKVQSVLVQTRQQGLRLFYRGDGFVILADDNDLQWLAKELNEALNVKALPWRGDWGRDVVGTIKQAKNGAEVRDSTLIVDSDQTMQGVGGREDPQEATQLVAGTHVSTTQTLTAVSSGVRTLRCRACHSRSLWHEEYGERLRSRDQDSVPGRGMSLRRYDREGSTRGRTVPGAGSFP